MYTEKNDVSMVYHTVKGVSHWAILRLLSGYIIIPKSSKSKFQWLRTAMNISFSLWLRSHGNNLLVCHFLDRMRIPLTRCMLILIHVYKYIIVYITLPWLGYCIYIYNIRKNNKSWVHMVTLFVLNHLSTVPPRLWFLHLHSKGFLTANDGSAVNWWMIPWPRHIEFLWSMQQKKSGEQWKTTISVTTDT